MKLIGSLTSPYVRKVRIVMAEKKLDFQLVLEDVWASDAMLKSNPLGKVPCLVMEGSEAVFDSRVIVEYLDTLSPVGKLIPPMGRERIEVRTWEALADGLLDASILARLEAHWAGRADFVLLQARSPEEALRLRAQRLLVVRGGEVLSRMAPAAANLSLPGRPPCVDFTRQPPGAAQGPAG